MFEVSGGIEDNEDNEGDKDDKYFEDVNIKVSPIETVIATPITIWVRVLPDTLTGEAEFHSLNDILNLLKEYGISDIDVAYYGPKLFAPISNHNPPKAIINPVTPCTWPTMDFYFGVDQDLYAVAAHHILFPKGGDHSSDRSWQWSGYLSRMHGS